MLIQKVLKVILNLDCFCQRRNRHLVKLYFIKRMSSLPGKFPMVYKKPVKFAWKVLNYMTYVSSCYLSLTCLQALHPYLFALSTHVAYVTSRFTCCHDLLVFLVTRTLRALSGFALEVLLIINKIT